MIRNVFLLASLFALTGALLEPSAGAMDLARLIAPTTVCADQADPRAPAGAQERAMRCMSDYARQRMRMGRLGRAADLDRSAVDKSADIIRCDSFSHYACGRGLTYWMQQTGYIPAPCWRVGENIAQGRGERGSVRVIFRTWLHSPPHRENILGHYSQIGVGLKVGKLGGRSDVHVWTQDFGSHCSPPRPRRHATPRVARLHAGRAVG